jgi:hypothetical protein
VRIVGIVLVILGALALGYGGFPYATQEKVVDARPVEAAVEREKPVSIPPVVGGIAVVGGLILLATNGRQETA